MKKIYSIIVFCSVFSYCFAQLQDIGFTPANNLVPNSPQAAILMKFEDIPVGHYTGTPSVNVPLQSIQEGPLSLNFSLSYHSGGHKVQEVAPWVGLGWKLNGGGMITRKVRGKADDRDREGNTDHLGFIDFKRTHTYEEVKDLGNLSDDYDISDEEDAQKMALGCWDTQPDEFYFSFAGYSGKFTFDWDTGDWVGDNWEGGFPIISSKSKVRFGSIKKESNGQTIISWEMIAPDGTRFLFDVPETTSTTIPYNDPSAYCRPVTESYTSSWYLTKVISPYNDAHYIELEYDDYLIEREHTSMGSVTYYETDSDDEIKACRGERTENESPKEIIPTTITSKVLKKVTTSTGIHEIEFKRLNDRTDINTDYLASLPLKRLDEVVMTTKAGDFVSKYELDYQENSSRLLLTSVQRTTEGTASIPPYQFTYENTELPDDLDSRSIDHWGFYNGSSATTAIPEYTKFISPTEAIHYMGSDRNPYFQFAKAQSLIKVEYPTGGWQELTYELNDYSWVNDEAVSSFQQFQLIDKDESVSAPISGGINNVATITITPTQKTAIEFTINGIVNGNPLSIEYPQAKLLNGNQTLVTWTIEADPNASATDQKSVTFTEHLILEAGTYTIEARKENANDNITVDAHWMEVNMASPITEKAAGGIRIQQIEAYDSDGSLENTRRFEYDMSGGLSSGVIYNEPVYSYDGTSRVCTTTDPGGNPIINICHYTQLLATTQTQVGSTSGSHIGYRRVTEYAGQSGENGKTIYEFTSPFDHPDIINNEKPFASPKSNEFKTALPTFKTVFNADGDIVFKEEYSFEFSTKTLKHAKIGLGQFSPPLFSNLAVTPVLSSDPCENAPQLDFNEIYSYSFEDMLTGHAQPKETKVSFYYKKPNTNEYDIVTTTHNYVYDMPLHLVKETQLTNSDGKQYITRNKYPLDYETPSASASGAASGIKNLIDRHVIGTPVEITQYVKDFNSSEQILSSTLTEFKSTGFPYPDKVWKTEYKTPRYKGAFKPSYIGSDQSSFIKDDDYQCHKQDLPSLTYNHYDDFGNPTEIQQTFNQPVAVTWSYDGARVTSITKNAAYEEVAFTSFEHPYDGNDLSVVIMDGGWNYKMEGVSNSNNAYYNFTDATGDDRIVYSNTNVPLGDYFISFWAYGAGTGSEKILIKKDNTTIFELPIENDIWKHYSQIITLGQGDANAEISIDGGGGSLEFVYVDDLRLHPTDAMMTSYAYAKNSKILTGISDESHRRTEYEYDDLIRLKAVRDFEDYILQTIDYYYASDGNAQGKNYIATQEPLVEEDDLSFISSLEVVDTEVRRTYQYFDGLGRFIQSNNAEASANERDLITFVEYDEFNRVKKKYLPFAYNHAIDPDGSFLDNPSINQAAFYNSLSSIEPSGEGNHAFSENTYEPSPLNRIEAQNAPGQAWSKTGMDNAIITVYRSNSNDAPYSDDVHDFTQGKRTAHVYPNDALNVTEMTDENGNVSRTFVDKIGRTVMTERVLSATEVARIYTVYDDYNLPIAVIPPQLAADMEAADDWNIYTMSNFRRIYAYQYDHRRLVKIKAVPGGGTTKLFYNKLDLPVMTIDNNGNKIITKYDILNRPILTGDYNGSQEPDNSTNTDVFEEIDATKTHFYTLGNSFPTDADGANLLAVHSVTYYDDYDFNNNGTDNVTYIAPPNTTDYESTASPWTRNVVTSTKTGVLEENGTTNTFLEEHTFYDNRARVIQLQSDNHLSGQDNIFSSYSFPGWLLKMERQHSATVQGVAKNYTIKERYEYDHTGREIAMYHEIDNNGEIKTCAKTYDERNLLSQKTLHETSTGSDSYLQYIDYKYNIRGWMTDINDVTDTDQCVGSESTSQPIDLFSLHLAYNNNPNSNINPFVPQYNGNIAAMEWVNYACGERRAYAFTYDNFDRLTKAEQYFFGGTYSKVDHYGIPEIKYDLDGNIESLQRRGELPSSPNPLAPNHGLIDDLSYTYSTTIPNHLTTVTENVSNASDAAVGFQGTSSYTYDKNGNLKTDSKKGFNMNYNYLNLPNKASFSTANFNPSNDFIEWQYDAMGQKLQKKVTASSSVSVEKEYCSGIEYNNGELEAIYFSEGRIVPDGTNWVYEYTISDHLGNNRVTFKDDGMGVAELIDENHYYPFGMLIEDLTMRTNSPDNDYLYNGKELDEEFGFNLHYYGARSYDASIARFCSIDPLAKKYYSINPYVYVANNPIKFIDPDGKRIRGVKYRKDGTFKFSNRAEKNGTKRYVEARSKTRAGKAQIMSMIKAKKKFSLFVTDKLLVNENPNGTFSPAKGLTYQKDGIIAISTVTGGFDDITPEQAANAVKVPNKVPVNKLEDAGASIEKLVSGDPNSDFATGVKAAIVDAEMKDFVKNGSKYGSPEAQIHAVGAHEEVHLLDNEAIKANEIDNDYQRGYQTELPAYKAERKAIEDYKRENKQ